MADGKIFGRDGGALFALRNVHRSSELSGNPVRWLWAWACLPFLAFVPRLLSWITKLIIDTIVRALLRIAGGSSLWWLVDAEFALAIFGSVSPDNDYLDALAETTPHVSYPGDEALC